MTSSAGYVCDQLDRLMTVEFRVYGHPGKHQTRGTVSQLYDAARAKTDRALTQVAAEGLVKNINRGDIVIITTGWLIPFWAPNGETDGTPGAIAIARALSVGLGARVVFMCEETVIPVIAAGCVAAGLRVYDQEFLLATPNIGQSGGVSIVDFTLDATKAVAHAKTVLDIFKPKAIIATEKPGRNRNGVYHTGLGSDMSEVSIKIDYLIDEARSEGILTVGIIDIGNEIGAGSIAQEVRKIMPFAETCKCPCEGGTASVVATDALIVASACNFGSYALAAALAAELDDISLAHSRETEALIMQECGRAGAIDGALLTAGGFRNLNGVALDDYAPLIDLMRTVVKSKTIRIQIDLLRP